MDYLEGLLSYTSVGYDWATENPDLAVLATGITALLVWTAWMVLRVPSTSRRGIAKMGKRRTTFQKDKIVSALTNVIEGEILLKRMTRIEARLWYAKFGKACDIGELMPVNPQATKGLIKHRLKTNGYDPVNIPGGALIQEVIKGRSRGNIKLKSAA